MCTLRRVDARDVADLRAAYMRSLAAPLDDMWETFAGLAAHWEMLHAGERIGYACVNDEHQLLQFSVSPPFAHRSTELFEGAIDACEARGAFVSTFEPWLALCVDRQRTVRVHTLLYHDHHRKDVPLHAFENARFDVVEEAERRSVEDFVRRCLLHDPGEWLTGYLERLVARRELWTLSSGETLLGTGELRGSESQPPHANLGVIVSPEQRGRGLASHILFRLKERAYDAGLVPICSTTVDNAPARKAIANAGFFARHRLLEVRF